MSNFINQNHCVPEQGVYEHIFGNRREKNNYIVFIIVLYSVAPISLFVLERLNNTNTTSQYRIVMHNYFVLN